MKKLVLTFGLISGAISAGMMIITMPFQDGISDHSYILGYTTLVLSFLLVYFGIRSYRDNAGSGQITFARAFTVGILITLVSCVCYVVAWEIIYFNFMHDFMDKYSAHILQRLQASGASAAALQAKTVELNKSKAMYENPVYNSALTFLEPFPVGLVITLISAAILRKKPQPQTAPAPLPTA